MNLTQITYSFKVSAFGKETIVTIFSIANILVHIWKLVSSIVILSLFWSVTNLVNLKNSTSSLYFNKFFSVKTLHLI